MNKNSKSQVNETQAVDAKDLKKALNVNSKLRAGVLSVVGGKPIVGPAYCLGCGRGL